MLAFGLTGFSQTKTWHGTDHDWFNSSNWTPVGVPTATDEVVISPWLVGPLVIQSGGADAVAKSFTLSGHLYGGGDMSLTVHGNLTVFGVINIEDNTDFIVSAGGTVTYGADVHVKETANLHVNGTMEYVPPASLVVTNNGDSGPNTLRQAVFYIADGGTITFNLPTGNEDIALVTPLTIEKSLTIDGANTAGSGGTVEVWQNGLDIRIFHITTAAAGKTIGFKNMQINLGYGTSPGGGGILCEAGTLNVDNVYFYQNDATGTGASDGGGAIHAINSTCNITNSTFDDNISANDGAGMYVSDGDVTITGCTFSNNQAGENGGGIRTSGSSTDITTIINSTFAGNTVYGDYGGAMYVSNSLNMKFTTVSGNALATGGFGGGVRIAGYNSTLTMQNCLLGNNTSGATNDNDIDVLGTVLISNTHNNIIEVPTGKTIPGSNITGQQDDLFGTGLDTQTLADNGGPTQTLAILGGSVAHGAGTVDAAVPTDQRGVNRTDPPTIGAFESFEVGDFYAGGVVFWLDGNGGGLVCDIYNQQYHWWNGENLTTGATATAIGTGQANTTTIIDVQGTGDPGTYAAEYCANFTSGGYSDWFLPSQDELFQMHTHFDIISTTSVAQGGELLEQYGEYWSSTELSQERARAIQLAGGAYDNTLKNAHNMIRAVRAF